LCAYVYFEEQPGRRAAAKLLTKDEAPRIAANIAKLADLLGGRAPAAVRQVTAHDDGRGDDDAAGIRQQRFVPPIRSPYTFQNDSWFHLQY
jgi:hypothetical protein